MRDTPGVLEMFVSDHIVPRRPMHFVLLPSMKTFQSAHDIVNISQVIFIHFKFSEEEIHVNLFLIR